MKEKIDYFFSACPPHFFILYACFLLQMFNFGEGHRFVMHLNLLMVIASYTYLFSKSDNNNTAIFYMLSIPLLFILLHVFTGTGLVYSGAIRTIIFATVLMLSIWVVMQKDGEYVTNNIFRVTVPLLILYAGSQAVALWWLDKPYGTMSNPHYLAINSAIALIVSLYFFFRVSFLWKLLFGLCVILFGTFILLSLSRPTWVALIFSGIFMIIFAERKYKNVIMFSMLSISIGLVLTNIAGFSDRLKTLFMNLGTEERVFIWQDTWRMQMDSSVSQWLVGHGLNTFENDFMSYSKFHLENHDFNSPHNFILEILYLSGVLGLVLLIVLFVLLYKKLLLAIKSSSGLRDTYLLLFFLLTTNLITVSITLPFFSRYNLNIIAIVVGGLLIMKEIPIRKAQ